jgi:hypothetical protein
LANHASAAIHLGSPPEEGCVEKPRGFFNTDGAPGTGVGVEKPGGFFNTEQNGDDRRRTLIAELGPATLPSRGGRPTVLSQEVKEQLYLLVAIGLSRRQAAAQLGIDPSTICRAAGRDEEFSANLRLAEEQSTIQPMATVIAASRTHWRAAAWLIRHKLRTAPPPTEDEKEEKHRSDLADGRRMMEWMHECQQASRELTARSDFERWQGRRAGG